MKMAEQYGLQVDTVESDSKNLIDAINGKQKPPNYCDIVIGDIRRSAEEVRCRSFHYIPREQNQVAHYAARGDDFLSIHHTPTHLVQYVILDSRD